MRSAKNRFNYRAFTAMMAGLSGLILPVSGLVLHARSEGAAGSGRHEWLMIHVIFGVLFVAFAGWHIVLNRRPLLNYFKAAASRSILSREAFLALAVVLTLLLLLLTQPR